MNILNGIINFFTFVVNNWTGIAVIIGLAIGIFQKAREYAGKTKEEKIAIAKRQIHEIALSLVTKAETDYTDWNKAGKIKRSEVITQIYDKYPVLKEVLNQEELVAYIDAEIDNALKNLEEVIAQGE